LLESAERALVSSGLDGLLAAVRARRGELLLGEEGKALRTAASHWMVGQGVRDPAAMISMMLPGSPP
jgi:hypothetical protein